MAASRCAPRPKKTAGGIGNDSVPSFNKSCATHCGKLCPLGNAARTSTTVMCPLGSARQKNARHFLFIQLWGLTKSE